MNKKNRENLLLIVVGMAGSGKSSVIDFLRERNWQIVHFGQITIDELKKRNLPINEKNERAIREEIRKVHGMGAYAKLSLPKIKDSLLLAPTAIDGLYSWSELKLIKNTISNQIIIVAVFCPRHLRYKRLAAREFRPLTYIEAELRDIAEIENLEKGGPIAMADYTIINDGTIERLNLSFERILYEINNDKMRSI